MYDIDRLVRVSVTCGLKVEHSLNVSSSDTADGIRAFSYNI